MSGWRVTLLNSTVVAELEAMPADIRARFSRIAGLIEAQGLEAVRESHAKHLRNRLWEMRMIGRDGIARAIYVTGAGRRVVEFMSSERNRRGRRRGFFGSPNNGRGRSCERNTRYRPAPKMDA